MKHTSKLIDSSKTLKNSYLNLCRRLKFPQDIIKINFNHLLSKYSESSRHYHNIDHIRNCLGEFDEVADEINFSDEIELAIWYHDILYDIESTQNEEDSAEFTLEICLNAGTTERFSQKVYRLIMATSHQGEVETAEEKFIIDIDLSILGKPEPEYDEFEKNIRLEYGSIPDEIFFPARINVLQNFLKRPKIYLTEHFRKKYETQAGINMKNAIENLKRQLV